MFPLGFHGGLPRGGVTNVPMSQLQNRYRDTWVRCEVDGPWCLQDGTKTCHHCHKAVCTDCSMTTGTGRLCHPCGSTLHMDRQVRNDLNHIRNNTLNRDSQRFGDDGPELTVKAGEECPIECRAGDIAHEHYFLSLSELKMLHDKRPKIEVGPPVVASQWLAERQQEGSDNAD